jgi:hypothetical protein
MPEILDYSEIPIPQSKIVETWEAAFGEKFDYQYFTWRFKNNPNESKVYIKYLMDGGTLVAYYAVSPMLMGLPSGETIKVALSNMTMTHPDYTGNGYFQLLASQIYAQLKQDGYACVFTYPVRDVSCHIFRKYLNFRDITTLKTMQLSKESFKKVLTSEYSFETGEVGEVTIIEAQSLTYTDSNLLLRDAANLRWRLIDNPVCNYYYLKVVRADQTKMIVFYKYYDDSIDIMDYCFSLTDYLPERDFSAALSHCLNQASPVINGVNIWTDIDSDEFAFYSSIGFIPTSTDTFFGIIPLNDDASLLKKENWHYRYYDSDVF